MDETNKVDRRGRRRRSLFAEMFLGFMAIDILVGFLLVAMWLLSFDTRDLAVALPLSVGLFALRFGAWAGFLYRGLEPVRTWQQGDIREDEQTLLAVEQHLFRLPRRLNAVFAAGWGAYFIALPLLMWFGFPEAVAIGPGELPACVLQVLTVIVGAYAIYSQLSKVLIDHTLARIARALDPSKHRRLRDRVSLAPRMLWTGFALIVGPSAWLASLAWLETVHTARDLAVAEARADVDAAARVLEAGPESGQGPSPLEVVFVDPEQLPQVESEDPAHSEGFDVRQERAWAATRLADGRWISSQRDVELCKREVALSATPTKVAIGDLPAWAAGVLTATLYDAQGRPYFLWDVDMSLEAFVKGLSDPDPAAHNKRDGLIYCENDAVCPPSRTADVVKAACTAVFGSAVMLLQ